MNKKYTLKKFEFLGDTITPVSAYLSLRDHFADCKLLESAEYGNSQNSKSIICFNNLESIEVSNAKYILINKNTKNVVNVDENLSGLLGDFFKSITNQIHNPEKHNTAALIGYVGYDAIQYFDSIMLNDSKTDDLKIPEMCFGLFEFTIVFDHFHNRVTIFQFEHSHSRNDLQKIYSILNNLHISNSQFFCVGDEMAHDTDSNFLSNVEVAKNHCKIGDIFQVVLSRKFSQKFSGDDFVLYRNLRHINPSPYMFYFDYGNFKLFGSSPESHLLIKGKNVTINPIAGTIKRNGNDEEDKIRLDKLVNDPKENAEHDMLIDLARNDLSIHCKNVELKHKKEVQQFSHVFHLVSEVEGQIKNDANIFEIVSKTFPAGTLSGAPKYKAMQIIDKLEDHKRNYYGGAIGFIDLESNVNLAIMIRTFCSKNNALNYSAGAGITIESVPENELLEIQNKLNALRKAIELANIKLN